MRVNETIAENIKLKVCAHRMQLKVSSRLQEKCHEAEMACSHSELARAEEKKQDTHEPYIALK